MEDTAIVDLFLQRDETAVARCAERYGKRLRSASFALVRDARTAEECENDTYLAAWNSIPPHEPRAYLGAYLLHIVRHLSLDRCRRDTCLKRDAVVVELTHELQECLPAGEERGGADGLALREALNAFLAALPAEKRNVFLRRYWFADSVAEIAARYGLSQSKVKSVLFRTRKQLADALTKEGLLP